SQDTRLAEEQLALCQRELLRLRLEKAETQVKLERRKGTKEASGEVRASIADLQDRLAVLTAQENVLRDEQERLLDRSPAERKLDSNLAGLSIEMELTEAATRRLAAAVEDLSIELLAPSRVRMLERAQAPGTQR